MATPSIFAPSNVMPSFRHGTVLVLVGLLLTLPAFWTGNVLGHDTLFHLVMSRQFIAQLFSGELYPRWLAGVNDGLGSPVMFFYGPVPYYITALLHPLAGNDPEGWHQLGMAAALAVIASGFTAYAWLRCMADHCSALIGALLYMSAPYHLVVDLYQRFAFAELWGFVWTPLMLFGIHAFVNGWVGAWLAIAGSYALLIMTHLPTALLFSWVPLLYGLWLAMPGQRISKGAQVIAAMTLGIGLSAIFLLPALLMQPYMQFQTMESGRFSFASNFLYGSMNIPALHDFVNHLRFVMTVSAMIMIGAYAQGQFLFARQEKHLARFWFLVGGIAICMQLPLSQPAWQLFPVLQKVQFPWRFGTVVTLASVILLVLWLKAAGKLFRRTNLGLVVILALIALSELVPIVKFYQMYHIWMARPSLARVYDVVTDSDDAKIAKIDGYTYFLTRWSPPGLDANSLTSYQTLSRLVAVPAVEPLGLSSPIAQLRLQKLTARHLVLYVNSSTHMDLRIRQFYLPGWTAVFRGKSRVLEVKPSVGSGLIEINAPAGSYIFDLKLEPDKSERIGLWISLISVIVFIMCWVKLYCRARCIYSGSARNVWGDAQTPKVEQVSNWKQD